jgi:hypothetical protein
MRRRLSSSAGFLAIAVGISLPGTARAAETAAENKPPEKPRDTSDVLQGAEGETPGGESEDEKKEETVALGADLVLGWGHVPFAVENPPAEGAAAPTYTRQDDVHSSVQSLILGASMEIVEHLGVGVRVPFTFASFFPDGSPGRGAQSFGNVELEGEYGRELRPGLKLYAALGVALPTAAGTEIPEGQTNASAVLVDAPSYDRFSLSRAAASARGYEDNALFEPHRLGIVPKVGAVYRLKGLSIEPYVKVENLVAATSQAEGYVGELVAALRVGYEIRNHFEVALKGWVNVGFAGSSDDKTVAAALEPELVLRFGPLRPYAGAIVPIAGPPLDNAFVGVRLGVGASF